MHETRDKFVGESRNPSHADQSQGGPSLMVTLSAYRWQEGSWRTSSAWHYEQLARSPAHSQGVCEESRHSSYRVQVFFPTRGHLIVLRIHPSAFLTCDFIFCISLKSQFVKHFITKDFNETSPSPNQLQTINKMWIKRCSCTLIVLFLRSTPMKLVFLTCS